MVHGALSVEEFWMAATRILRFALTFHQSSMALLPAGNSPGALRVSNPVPDLGLYGAKMEAMAPVYVISMRNPTARAVRLSDHVPLESLIGTPFYKNFMKPEGWRDAVSMIFREEGRMLGRLCLNRRSDQGDFTDEEVALVEDMYPHFNVAAQRVRRFETERTTDAAPAQSASDDPAILLLDERCAPLFHNRAASRICGAPATRPGAGACF